MTDPITNTELSSGGSMTEDELSEIEKRMQAATPGPWLLVRPAMDKDGWQLGIIVCAVPAQQCVYVMPPGGTFPEADRRFIAHAREDVPKLIAEVRRLRAEKADR